MWVPSLRIHRLCLSVNLSMTYAYGPDMFPFSVCEAILAVETELSPTEVGLWASPTGVELWALPTGVVLWALPTGVVFWTPTKGVSGWAPPTMDCSNACSLCWYPSNLCCSEALAQRSVTMTSFNLTFS